MTRHTRPQRRDRLGRDDVRTMTHKHEMARHWTLLTWQTRTSWSEDCDTLVWNDETHKTSTTWQNRTRWREVSDTLALNDETQWTSITWQTGTIWHQDYDTLAENGETQDLSDMKDYDEMTWGRSMVWFLDRNIWTISWLLYCAASISGVTSGENWLFSSVLKNGSFSGVRRLILSSPAM